MAEERAWRDHTRMEPLPEAATRQWRQGRTMVIHSFLSGGAGKWRTTKFSDKHTLESS